MSYIGQGLGQGQAERFTFTAAGGETSITVDDAGRGIAYTVGQLDVYLNGVKLVNGTDFTATSGSSITGLSALSASDVIDIVALSTFDAANMVSASVGGTFSGPVEFDAAIKAATGLYENSATVSANYSITSGNNAMSAGPVTVATGVTVTIPTGSVWTIV